jgi:hypothetical protein
VWRRLTLPNTLAYFDTAKITAEKGFIAQAQQWERESDRNKFYYNFEFFFFKLTRRLGVHQTSNDQGLYSQNFLK